MEDHKNYKGIRMILMHRQATSGLNLMRELESIYSLAKLLY